MGPRLALINGAWALPDGTIPGIWGEETRALAKELAEVQLIMLGPRSLRHRRGSFGNLQVTFVGLPSSLPTLPRPMRLWLEVPGLFWGVLGLLRQHRTDVIRFDDTIISGIPTIILSRIFDVPTCVFLAGSVVETAVLKSRKIGGNFIGRVVGWIEGTVLRRVDCVIAVNDELVRHARSMGARKVVITQSYVDLELFASRPQARSVPVTRAGKNIYFIGRLEREKGVLDLLDAFTKVAAELPRVNLYFAGYGSERDTLEKRTRERDLDARVHFLGGVPHPKVPGLLNEADIFVLPSYTEGSPVAALEAMLSEVCLVATAVGSIPELLTPGVHYARTEVRDVAGLAAALITLASDDDLRLRLAQAGRRRALELTADYVPRNIGFFRAAVANHLNR